MCSVPQNPTTIQAPFQVLGEQGNPLFGLVEIDGKPLMTLYGPDGQPWVQIGARTNAEQTLAGYPAVVVCNPETGQPSADLGSVDNYGEGALALYSPKGALAAELGSLPGEYGGELRLFSPGIGEDHLAASVSGRDGNGAMELSSTSHDASTGETRTHPPFRLGYGE